MTTKPKQQNLFLTEAKSKLKLTDAEIEIQLQKRLPFFKEKQVVQRNATTLAVQEIIDLVTRGCTVIPDECRNTKPGIYQIVYIPPHDELNELKKAFIEGYREQLKERQTKELDEIVNQLMVEYADRLATESEKEISNKKEIAKAELLKQLLEI